MINRVIRFSIEQRYFILVAALLLAGAGIWSATQLPIDAVPDITNKQVQVNTTAPGLAPSEVEQQNTFPMEFTPAGTGWQLSRKTADMLLVFGDSPGPPASGTLPLPPPPEPVPPPAPTPTR